MVFALVQCPLGVLKIEGDDNGIQKVDLTAEKETTSEIPKELIVCVNELDHYFKNTLKKFTVKLNPKGTEFQCTVWKALQEIPYSECISYKKVAEKIQKPKAVRAVANAIGKNPILLIIPCHRVIGSDGSLTGFSAGMENKKWLLKHEGMSFWEKK